MAFVQFTKEDFERRLAASVRAIVDEWDVNQDGIRIQKEKPAGRRDEELVYRIYTGKGQVYIKVFSSIDSHTGVSRDYASDAIRVALIDELSDKPVMAKQAHVKRIDTWGKNLTNRLFDTFDAAYGLPMCDCGSPKVERDGKNGKFFGCLNYHKAHGGSK